MSDRSPQIVRRERLTLVLADVFVPASASPADAVSPQPMLERLLRFASAARLGVDWRSWVATQWAVAAATRWRATPVVLEARLDHVRLTERGVVLLDDARAEELVAQFAATFGPEWRLERSARGDFNLLGGALDHTATATTDPATLLGGDVRAGLAHGGSARAVRALSAEIEMWMHGKSTVSGGAARGFAGVSSLWLWHARDLGALERGPVGDCMTWLRALPATAPAVATLWPMTRGSLDALEHDWLGPSVAAVAEGQVDTLELIANDCVFRLRRGDLWKLWRRPRGWLDALRGPVAGADRG